VIGDIELIVLSIGAFAGYEMQTMGDWDMTQEQGEKALVTSLSLLLPFAPLYATTYYFIWLLEQENEFPYEPDYPQGTRGRSDQLLIVIT